MAADLSAGSFWTSACKPRELALEVAHASLMGGNERFLLFLLTFNALYVAVKAIESRLVGRHFLFVAGGLRGLKPGERPLALVEELLLLLVEVLQAHARFFQHAIHLSDGIAQFAVLALEAFGVNIESIANAFHAAGELSVRGAH